MPVTNPPIIGYNVLETETRASQQLGYPAWFDQTRYQYVQASGAKVAGTVYSISPAGILGAPVTITTGSEPQKLGIPQVAFADGEYGWVAIEGIIPALSVLANCAANVELYLTATAGAVDDGTFSATNLIPGLKATAAVGASAGVVAAFASQTLTTLGN